MPSPPDAQAKVDVHNPIAKFATEPTAGAHCCAPTYGAGWQEAIVG
jgi:hypothetical protein